MSIKVGLVGYGSQGRRIADAISAQKDMKLVGVCLKKPDITAHMAFLKGLSIYAVDEESAKLFEQEKVFEVKGMLEDLISKIDVIVDATPAGVGKKNREVFYQPHGVKAVFLAGETPDVADIPAFIPTINYKEAVNVSYVRIPTPYTVAMIRPLELIEEEFSVKWVSCTMLIAGSEFMRGHMGPVDTIIPIEPENLALIKREFELLMPRKELILSSFKIPSLHLSVQHLVMKLSKEASVDRVIKVLTSSNGIILVSSKQGLNSTDSILEFIRRIRPNPGDIYEVCIWKESIQVVGRKLALSLAFDSHSVHIPELIDAIRALSGYENADESMWKTDTALNILHPGVYP